MKIRVLLATLAVLAAASCTKNNMGASVADRKGIVFDVPVMTVATRGADEITEFPKAQDFKVYAHYYPSLYTSYADGLLYMDNVTVSFDESLGNDGAWAPTPINYYWPLQGTLTFAAYSPIEGVGTVTYDDSGFSFDDFVVNDFPEQQIDLLFSERSYNQESYRYYYDEEIPYDGVQINFLHALSSVLFEIKADKVLVDASAANQYEFKVRKIKLYNVYNKGSFNQGLPITGINQMTPAPAENDWICDTASETDYVVYSEDINGPLIVDSDAATSLAGSSDTSFILMPQSLTHGDKNVKIEVLYDLRHSGMNENEYITGNTVEAFLSTSTVSHWLRGKRYVYTLTLGLNEIKFAPKVEAWVTMPNIDL